MQLQRKRQPGTSQDVAVSGKRSRESLIHEAFKSSRDNLVAEAFAPSRERLVDEALAMPDREDADATAPAVAAGSSQEHLQGNLLILLFWKLAA